MIQWARELLTINCEYFYSISKYFSIIETNVFVHAFTSLSHYKNGKYQMTENLFS